MSLTCSGSHRPGLLHIAFNQDSSCIAIGTSEGIRIYNIESHQICYKSDIGAVGIAEMLFCTSLAAFVGAGEQPALTPRKLTIMNTATSNAIQDINFVSSVLAVRINRQRLVVVLERRVHVHALQTLEHLRTLETPPNPSGLAALTPCNEPCLLALPAAAATGALRVYDLLVDGGNALCELNAHQGQLGALAWNHDGTLLASASTKGTVLRVHKLPGAGKAYSFRRGTYPATVHCLAFSPAGVEPPLLAAASSHGTVHLFRLEVAERHPAMVAASAAAGLLSAVVKYSVSDMVEPQRNIATVRLPSQGVPCVCALQAPAAAAAAGLGPISEQGNDATGDQVGLVVATAEGLLYEYGISALSSQHGPKWSLEGEWTLVGAAGLS